MALPFDRALWRLARANDPKARWRWRDVDPPALAGYAFFNALEEEQMAVAALAPDGDETSRILTLAQIAFGRLRALLAAVDDDLLDRAPAAGEWSLRETLAHTIGVERSYRANTQHALVRHDDEPLTLPAERRPQPDPDDTSGGVLDILAAFAARRAETDTALAGLDAQQLVRPSQWGPYEVPHRIDVRFRLHRFASHIVEHTVQCEKALESLGVTLNDPRAVVRAIGTARGAHERRSSRPTLEALDAALHARADAIGA
ncbi:MAG: DinB family protein [Candidatus Limnocylindria bacterium]